MAEHEPTTTAPEDDEFYIGYMAEAPAGVAGHAKRWIFIVLATIWSAAALVAVAQRPFAVAFFDFGAPRAYEGVLEAWPHPMLRVDRPGADNASSVYYLVGFGKHGAESDVQEFWGQRVKLEGTPIYRDNQTMLEVVAGSVETLDDNPAITKTASVPLGRHTLKGEIVDSKCHFGVMKPGNLKPHRACATLCIRGGIPPVFIVRQEDGGVRHLLLVGSDGRALNNEILDWIAEPMEITGELIKMDDLFMLKAEPASFKSVS